MNNLSERLPVYVTGEGEPLLMIHGIISDASFFQSVTEILAKDFKTITYDRRGYGEDLSDWDGEYSVSAQADDAIYILEKYAKSPAWILGNSAGGLIALELAQKRPDLVKGLLLLEPSLNYDDESREMLREWNEELNSYLESKKIKKALTAFTRVVGNESAVSKATTLQEIKRTYKNLNAFMYGEINGVQRYFPPEENLMKMDFPISVMITEQGKDTIFAKSSLKGAERIGWNVQYLPGYHNAIKDLPDSSAQIIRKMIQDFKRLV